MRWYKTKMQTALNLGCAIALMDIYGIDVFDEVNHLDNDLNLITKKIQPHFTKENRLKIFKKELKQLEKEYPDSRFEFLIK